MLVPTGVALVRAGDSSSDVTWCGDKWAEPALDEYRVRDYVRYKAVLVGPDRVTWGSLLVVPPVPSTRPILTRR